MAHYDCMVLRPGSSWRAGDVDSSVMTDSRVTSRVRNGVCRPVPSLCAGDSCVCRTESIRWRIDYQLARGEVSGRAKQAVVERADDYHLRWSDHAPVTVQYR